MIWNILNKGRRRRIVYECVAKSVKKQKWNDILAADDKISTHGLVNSEKGNETNCCLCTQGRWNVKTNLHVEWTQFLGSINSCKVLQTFHHRLLREREWNAHLALLRDTAKAEQQHFLYANFYFRCDQTIEMQFNELISHTRDLVEQ